MARKFDEFHKDEGGKLLDQFRQSNPSFWERLHTSPEDIERVQRILDNMSQELDDLQAYQKEYRSERVGQEALQVFDQRMAHAPDLAKPVAQDVLSQESVLREARRRIDALEKQERDNVRQSGEEAARIVAKTSINKGKEEMSDVEKENHFKADLHKAVDTAQTARKQARKLFAEERENMIEEATKAGSLTPEKDASIAQAQTMKDIDDQEHKDIHAVFEAYGWERGKKAVQFNDAGHSPGQQEHTQALMDRVRMISQEKMQNSQNQEQGAISSEVQNTEENERER